ncbi:MAG: PQQ-binding-like beta-propeller repeat protein [Planctomycetes bacterium]|jgi:outer membrane protein assembly factor BamB|nr:PQQ-binding-like beta-propeller repeat protein [Phycisphaerae bacterium]NBB96259.1 PQQ-binding-like beta-propeller repeat protein [Planctomycetota bacterium]
MMHPKLITLGIPAALAVLAAAVLGIWAFPVVPGDVQARYPAFVRDWFHTDLPQVGIRLPQPQSAQGVDREAVDIGGIFQRFDAEPGPAIPGEWPAFRGRDRDNIDRSMVPLIRRFPPEGPTELWRIDLGEGYAGPAVLDSRVYVLDYDQDRKADMLRCFDLATGKELWRRGYDIYIKRQHGISRTVPAVSDRYVVTLGPKCQVMCCRTAPGKDGGEAGDLLWGIDLPAEYGTTVPPWYAGQCPLIEDGKAIIAPAGPTTLLIAVDCETGEVVWTTPNPKQWTMTHCSILPIWFQGRRMLIYVGSGGVAGVDGETGERLWTFADWSVKIANVPTPIDLGDGRLLLTGGYGAGAMFIRLVEEDGEIVVEPGKRLPPATLGAEQQSPILYDGFIYAVLPRVGAVSEQMACLDTNAATLWRSGPADKFGLCAFMIADGMILALNEAGELHLIEATPDGYRLLDKAKVLDGHEPWGPMALVDGRLICRELETMVCLDLRAEGGE